MKKVIQNGDGRAELSVSTVNNSEEKNKSAFMWKDFDYLVQNLAVELAIGLANLT